LSKAEGTMKSRDIRQSFVDFFAERGHKVMPSAPLVAHGDATLLFTNAGMVPFKTFFLGSEVPPSPRAVSVQKCMRVSGKHNDLENVGPSHRHHTFFEMLGNFSFGDYFKEEAIEFGWALVTEVWGIPRERLFATVFEEDDEAEQLWRGISGLPAERILRCGAKDNFWAMGDTGPCGPCSEIFVDIEPGAPAVDWEEGTETGRYLEIWNLVFMQYDRREDGELVPLPNPSIDTGAGMERLAATLQGVDSNYDTDLFRPLIEAAAAIAGTEYGRDDSRDVDLRVIADHVRAVTFLLADGVIPSNDGRGYVLRRLLRRAVRHGLGLGLEEPFLSRLVPVVGEAMVESYPELRAAEDASATTVLAEERRFLETLAAGSKQVQQAIDERRRQGESALPGAVLFHFYDTLGLPLETIREIAEEERFELDLEGFEHELEAQRRRSREAAGEAAKQLTSAHRALTDAVGRGDSAFVGYGRLLVEESRVVALARLGEKSAERVDSLEAGEDGVAVLEETPLYAESGGQLGDRGRLDWQAGAARVLDTQKQDGVHYHFVRIEQGTLASGQTVAAAVDPEWRKPTQRHHTATHLLHAVLRHLLGPSVRQAGSLVAPDRLRFDFTFGRALEQEEIQRIEDLVNRWILEARNTRIEADRSFDEAVGDGAMALFGEKYGERVRTVEVPALAVDDQELRSLELCGGCHVANVGEIGLFTITSERGIASGVRRIEARVGEAAQRLLRARSDIVESLAARLEVGEDRVLEEVGGLAQRIRSLERDLSDLRMKLVAGSEADRPVEVDGVKVVAREVPAAPTNEVRSMADVVRAKLGSGVVVLGLKDGDKVSFVAAVSPDLSSRVHAGRLAAGIAALVGGKGGGRADFAQAGGRMPEKLAEALAEVPELVREALES
jgi:alanyl-tRNA synthetase